MGNHMDNLQKVKETFLLKIISFLTLQIDQHKADTPIRINVLDWYLHCLVDTDIDGSLVADISTLHVIAAGVKPSCTPPKHDGRRSR
jgi:hypothetical protein